MKKLLMILIPILLFVGLAVPSAIAGDLGSGPDNPWVVQNNTWLAIAAKSDLWFYFDYSGDRSKIEITLDDYEVKNVKFRVYTPEQAVEWLQGKDPQPIGMGSKPGESVAAGHDLVWAGAFNYPGRFFVRVTNENAIAILFRLTVTGTAVALFPTPAPTPVPTPLFYTPAPTATLQGRLIFQQWSGGPIYTVNGDGTGLARVTYGLDPAWSPDGSKIAFSRWDFPAGLYIAKADGSNPQRMFDAPQLLSPQWSADGRRIAFARVSGGAPESETCFRGFCFTVAGDTFWRIGVLEIGKVIDADTTVDALTEPPSLKHSFAPTWSPNGKLVAFADAGFGIMSTDTTTPTIASLYTQNPYVQSPRYSPDGSRIVFQARVHDHWEILVMNADGSYPSGLTKPNPLAFKVTNNVAPTWSPDGKQVLFMSDRNGRWEFFVVNVDGTNLRQVLKNITDAVTIQYNFSNERVIDWTK